MRQFKKMLEDLGSRIDTAESTSGTWTVPGSTAKACEEMQHLQRQRDMLTTAGALLDDCNEQQGYVVDIDTLYCLYRDTDRISFHRFFIANHVLVPNQCLAKLDDLNTRMKLLHIAMDDRQKVLTTAGATHSPIPEDGIRYDHTGTGTIGPLPNLMASVKPPWERATTPANVPYYIE